MSQTMGNTELSSPGFWVVITPTLGEGLTSWGPLLFSFYVENLKQSSIPKENSHESRNKNRTPPPRERGHGTPAQERTTNVLCSLGGFKTICSCFGFLFINRSGRKKMGLYLVKNSHGVPQAIFEALDQLRPSRSHFWRSG